MSKKIVTSEQAPKPIGPYSQAVRAGDFLYVSGQIAIDAVSGELKTTDIVTETKQVMENIRAILEAGNMKFKHVVKTTIFLKSMDDFAKVNEIYGVYFPDAPPARETVQVSKLPRDVNVEISVIAYKN